MSSSAGEGAGRRPGAWSPRRRRAGLLAALSLVLFSGTSACREEAAPAGGPSAGFENLLLVTLDTTRADHLGCYGHSAAETPVLDALAGEGVRFELCIASTPTTLPSHATLLTGLEPPSHGARNNGTHRLPEEVATLAEHLRAEGFDTGAVVSALVLDSRFGLAQGFASYDDDLSSSTSSSDYGFRETKADDTLERARAWLAGRRPGRWFLWVHFFDPHSDYSPPEPYLSRFRDAPYDGELAFVDACLGRLLDSLRGTRELERTLIVVTSDHGESLGEHGELTHGIFIYDATTRVPLIVSHPVLAAGAVVEGVVGHVDVVPSVLELLGAPHPGDLDGRSLAGVLLGSEAHVGERSAYSESLLPYYNFGWSELRALRDRERRYVRAPRPELYELESDPGETRDLAAGSPELVLRYEAELAELLPAAELDARTADAGSLDPRLRADLARLGYTFLDSAEEEGRARPDPKDLAASVRRQQEAESLVARGKLTEAEAEYRAVLEDSPEAVSVRDALANLLMLRGRPAEALEVQLGTLELRGARAANFLCAAELTRELGRSGWRELLAASKRVDPGDPLPWVREADLVHMPADPAAARAGYEEALRLDGNCAPAWLGLCRVEAQSRNIPAAREAARRATEADPLSSPAWRSLGMLQAAGGSRDEALRCLRLARDADPADVESRLALALLLATVGREAEALAELRAATELDAEAVERQAAGKPLLRALLQRLR